MCLIYTTMSTWCSAKIYVNLSILSHLVIYCYCYILTCLKYALSLRFNGHFRVDLGNRVPECLHSGFYWS